jgi:hypothetical protein
LIHRLNSPSGLPPEVNAERYIDKVASTKNRKRALDSKEEKKIVSKKNSRASELELICKTILFFNRVEVEDRLHENKLVNSNMRF